MTDLELEHCLGAHRDAVHLTCQRCAARVLGQRTSPKKAAAARVNGAKGGRPPKSPLIALQAELDRQRDAFHEWQQFPCNAQGHSSTADAVRAEFEREIVRLRRALTQ